MGRNLDPETLRAAAARIADQTHDITDCNRGGTEHRCSLFRAALAELEPIGAKWAALEQERDDTTAYLATVEHERDRLLLRADEAERKLATARRDAFAEAIRVVEQEQRGDKHGFAWSALERVLAALRTAQQEHPDAP